MSKTNVTEMSPKHSLKALNPNVKLILFFALMQSIGRGIWMGNVLSSYIYLISGESNQLLGWTSAATGIMMTIVVFPAGILADRFRRDKMLRIAAVIGIIALAIIAFANNLTQIIISLVFWGFYQGVTRPSLEAIFADSVISGNRSFIYSVRQFVEQLGMMIGPLVNIVLFWILGDHWDILILKQVMLVGFIFSLASLIMMFWFDDNKSLGQSSESLIVSDIELLDDVTNENHHENESEIIQSQNKNGRSKRKIKKVHIPYILVGCNIIIGLGAGMTIKFFPIFFMEIYDMKPVLVQFITACTFLTTGILGIVAQKFSKSKGRAQIIFGVQAAATICLGIIATYPPLILLIIIYIARGALMNAAQPLSRSILMDVVPKKERGKWNSLEALAWGLFWNFSAVIGGYLIGSENNFQLNFFVTMGIYVVGTLPIILLFKIVSHEKS